MRASGGARKARKDRTPSSNRWLDRQARDPFVAAAKRRGLRSRAAPKLEALDDKRRLVKPGARVVDLGAAPGGWSQIAAKRAGPAGRVVAADILAIEPIEGVVVLRLDVSAPGAAAAIAAALGGPADVVLSDMAPAATGHGATDHIRGVALAETALALAAALLRPGGAFVAKCLQGGEEGALERLLKTRFARVEREKPPASRSESREFYFVATGFRGR